MKKNSARKRAYKMVDEICYKKNDIRNAVYEIRHDPHCEKKNTGGGYVRDPTANQAVALALPIYKVTVDGLTVTMPEKWLNIIDYVYSQCGDIERQIFDSRWNQKMHVVRATCELNIDRATYYDIVNRIKTYIVELGCEMGLVSVYESKKK